MAMELAKVWQPSDYRALTKRINAAQGCMAAKQSEGEVSALYAKEYAATAEACKRFLDTYNSEK